MVAALVPRWLTRSRALFLGALVVGFAVVWVLTHGAGGGHQVTARFTDADGLVAGNEVRIAGIPAGSVASVQPGIDSRSGSQYAEVTLSIDSAHWPLRQGTTIAVRPKGVLSNVYVDVEPAGATSASLGDHPFFNTDQTQSPVNLDELSNIFDPDVRTSIRTQIQEGTRVFSGSGVGDLNQTLVNANPLTRDAGPITAVLAQNSPQLDRLNGEFNTISGDLAREDQALRGLIANGDTFLGAIASREQQMQGTLVHADGVLTSLDQGLSGEQHNLQTIFADGPQALAETKQMADYLTPLIAAVNPHIADLDILLDEFVTATGYEAPGQSASSDVGGPLDTLRVDGTMPDPSRGSSDCGGQPTEQSQACPNKTGGTP